MLYTPFRGRVGDVVELIKYTYENTNGERVEDKGLRMLVSHHAACYIKQFTKDAAFGRLLADYADMK